jgi:hypothetical protein
MNITDCYESVCIPANISKVETHTSFSEVWTLRLKTVSLQYWQTLGINALGTNIPATSWLLRNVKLMLYLFSLVIVIMCVDLLFQFILVCPQENLINSVSLLCIYSQNSVHQDSLYLKLVPIEGCWRCRLSFDYC